MLTEPTVAVPDKPLDLSTMAIADKVSRYVHARYYQAHLDALQSEARRCGSSFAQGAYPDYMPADVFEHLALAIMVARDAYLSPIHSLAEHYAEAKRRLADGSAQTLLRDIVAALRALGLQFRVGPEGLDRESIAAQRLEWETPDPASKYSPPTLVESLSQPSPDDVIASVFAALERSRP